MNKKSRNLAIGCVAGAVWLGLLYWPASDATRPAAYVPPVEQEPTIQDLLFGEDVDVEPRAACRVVSPRRVPNSVYTEIVGRIAGGTDWMGLVNVNGLDASGALIEQDLVAPNADGSFTAYFDSKRVTSVTCTN